MENPAARMGCGVFLLAIEHIGKQKGRLRISPSWRNAEPPRNTAIGNAVD